MVGRFVPTLGIVTSLVLAGAACTGGDKSAVKKAETTTTSAPTTTTSAAPTTTTTGEWRLSASAYGPFRLKMPEAEVKASGQTKPFEVFCKELGGDNPTHIAGLTGGHEGSVVADEGLLSEININAGVTAEGFRIPSTVPLARQAYAAGGYTLTVTEPGPEDPFQTTLVEVHRNGQIAYTFGADPRTRKINAAWIGDRHTCD